jgi:hypothetical protein
VICGTWNPVSRMFSNTPKLTPETHWTPNRYRHQSSATDPGPQTICIHQSSITDPDLALLAPGRLCAPCLPIHQSSITNHQFPFAENKMRASFVLPELQIHRAKTESNRQPPDKTREYCARFSGTPQCCSARVLLCCFGWCWG